MIHYNKIFIPFSWTKMTLCKVTDGVVTLLLEKSCNWLHWFQLKNCEVNYWWGRRPNFKNLLFWIQNVFFLNIEHYLVICAERWTLGLDDLIVFKCFRFIFSLKKKTIQFPLSFNLYFQQKRAPKLSICHLPTKRCVWIFDVTNRANGFSNFQRCCELVMYFISQKLHAILKIFLNH